MGTVNLFFPENQDIARRCVELDDDIVNMQSTINGKFDDNAVVSNDLKTLVNDVMKAHNYKTYDELQAAVLASLTPEERKKIQATLDKFKELNEALDITFQVCMLITAVAGVVGLGTKAFMFIKSGSFMNALSKRVGMITDVFKSGRTIASAEEKAAETILEEVAEVGGEAAAESVELGTKVVRFCKFLAILGVAIDVFLIGLAAYEGSKQKEELIRNVHYLNIRRIYCKIYAREAEALVNFSSQLKAVLELMKQPNQEVMKPAIEALKDGFFADVDTVWKSHGILEAYNDLSSADGTRGSYLKEDLSLSDIKAELAKHENDPIDTAKPKSGTSVTTMVIADGHFKIPIAALTHNVKSHGTFHQAVFA